MYYPELQSYISRAIKATDQINIDRVALLTPLTEYIKQNQDGCQLTFICTHNSRRSHFGQIWARIAAIHFGLPNVRTFSGGTEATAFHPNAIAAIQRAGIKAEAVDGSSPHKIRLSFSDQFQPLEVFSKCYDDKVNPQKNFAAIMTCAEADGDCPVVFGADVKIPLHYQDPKVSDGTDQQDQTYDERCFQIATEMVYAFGQVVS